MSVKYVVPALAIAGRAMAASCSIAATTTVSNAADASALATCTTFTGSVAIATGTSDNIAFDGIISITGDLVANNVTQMTQISGSSLENIGGSFNLNDLTILSTLNFPRLTDVGSIVWEALPALQQLSFTTGVQTASELNIQNTELNSLDGIDLQVVDTFVVVNNPYLTDISMQLGNITDALTIGSNGQNVTASFPNLIWANNMTFRNVSMVDIASLEAVNGSLGFYSNEFSSLSAANLTTVGGSLSFVSNADLTNITMPELTTISGGFQIANNTKLESIDGFPLLATVAGALDFTGTFTEVELPALKDVRGAFIMRSSGDIDSVCTHFEGLNSVIKGKITCKGTDSSASGTTSTSGGSSSSSSGSSSSSSGAANGLYVPGAATGFMGVLAVIFGLM